MAEIAHQSLKNSSLYMSSVNSVGADLSPYVYSADKSYPNVYKDRNVKVRVDGASPSNSASVKLPSFGVVRAMTLQVDVAFKNGNTTNTPAVARNLYGVICKKIQLKNSSKEIETLHGDIIIQRVQNHPDRRRMEIAGCSNLVLYDKLSMGADETIKATSGGDTTFTCFIPLLFTTFEHPYGCKKGTRNGLDLRFCEQLTCDFDFCSAEEIACGGPSTSANTPLATAPNFTACNLWMEFDVLDSPDMDKIQSQNYSLSEAQSMINGNIVLTENTIQASAGGALDAVITVYNTQLANNMIICVHKKREKADLEALSLVLGAGTASGISTIGDTSTSNEGAKIQKRLIKPWKSHSGCDATATVAQSRCGADYVALDYCEVASAGRSLFKAESFSELQFLSGYRNVGTNTKLKWCGDVNELNDANGCSENNIFVIPFCEETHADRLTGSLALKSLNSIQVHLKATGLKQSGNYQVKIYTSFNQLLQIEANSGRIVKSISN